jgi:hypothetical protein
MSTPEQLSMVRSDLADDLDNEAGIRWVITADKELIIGKRIPTGGPYFITLNAEDFYRLVDDIQDAFAPNI